MIRITKEEAKILVEALKVKYQAETAYIGSFPLSWQTGIKLEKAIKLRRRYEDLNRRSQWGAR